MLRFMDKLNIQRFKKFLVESGQFPLVFYKDVELLQLCAGKGCVEIWQTIIVSDSIMDIFEGMWNFCCCCQVFGFFRQFCIICNNRSSAAAGDGFVAIKTQYPKKTEGSRMLSFIGASD